MTPSGRTLLTACWATLMAMVGWVLQGDLRGQPARWGVACVGLALVAAGVGWAVARQWLGGRAVAALAATASAGLCLLTPSLSDDVQRYLWEGRAQRVELAAPYLMPPSDDRLPDLPPGSRARVSHPDISASYPPLAEALCYLAARAADATGLSEHAFQLLMALFHLLTGAILWRTAGTQPRARALAAAYLLHPVALLEAPLGAHLDAAAGSLLVLGTVLARNNRWTAGVAWAASALIKPWAWLLLPWTLVWRRRGTALLAWGLTSLLLALPYAGAGKALWAGLWQYASRWEFNAGLYRVVFALVNAPWAQRAAEGRWLTLFLSTDGMAIRDGETWRPLWGEVGTDATQVLLDGRLMARGVCAGLLMVAVGWAVKTHGQHVEHVAFLCVLALLCVSPTVHPWYALMVLPLAALAQAPWVMTSLALLPACYTVWRVEGTVVTWTEASWPAPLFFGALALAVWRDVHAWRSDEPPTHHSPAPSNS